MTRPTKKPSPRRGSSPPGDRKLIAPSAEDIAAVQASSATARPTRAQASANPPPPRPSWHRVTGSLLVVLGVGLFAVNDLALLEIDIMPGGHQELWAPVAIGIAASSMWWFGWFDRGPLRR